MFVGCMGLCEHSNGIGYLVILIALVCLFQFGWAAAQISHLAMIPELTHVEAERDELNIIRYISFGKQACTNVLDIVIITKY